VIAADYWRSLYLATLAFIVAFRIGRPFVMTMRHRLRVAEVKQEAPGVISLRIAGRRLHRLNAQPGQFFLWRFLSRAGRWWEVHPFSLSEAPDGRSLRITVKALGDFTSRVGEIAPGTRVVAEGPFGRFTGEAARRNKVALVAGGIGITPIRALAEQGNGDTALVYRALTEDDLVLRDELEQLACARGIDLHYVVGDHATPEGRRLLARTHLQQLVPDIADREVYLCGPPAMAAALEKNLRRAGVSRKHLHTERFAL
jgi:ferredoxin-NADP reductase